MSVGETTLELWRRAPAWRFSLLGAIVMTVLALVIGKGGSGGSVTPKTPPSSSPTATAAPPNSSSPVQCGPQGQVTVQAPIVVSSNGRMPSNVKTGIAQTQPGGLSSSVQSRFMQFTTNVEAAQIELREGERCVKMQGALDKLQAADYAYADCFQKGKDNLISAQVCSTDLANSEKRFERLQSAFDNSREDRSADKIEELARARQRMTPFDESRELWNRKDKLVASGDSAVQTIAESNARISALKDAGDEPSGTDSLKKLATAAELTALDRARLSEQERNILVRADQAKEAITASNARLAAVEESLAGDPAENESSREQLIAALSALTETDLQLSTPVQKVAIEQARQTAGRFAVSDLINETENLDLDSAQPEIYQRLSDLLSAIERYGEQVDLSGSATRAIETARKAEARIARSERHIANMYDIVKRVQQGGPSELGADVIRVHNELDAFDHARMTDEDLQAFRRLESAREITLATKSQSLTRKVPLFVGVESNDALSQFALDYLRRGLRAAGFNLVKATEESAVTMLLNRSEVSHKSVHFSGSSLNTAEVTLTMSGKWTIVGKSVSIPSAKGDAVGSDRTSLEREAVKEAADGLIEQLKALTNA
jgi:hypothetical protein